MPTNFIPSVSKSISSLITQPPKGDLVMSNLCDIATKVCNDTATSNSTTRKTRRPIMKKTNPSSTVSPFLEQF